jgi:glucose/arabinose dehydrogenase
MAGAVGDPRRVGAAIAAIVLAILGLVAAGTRPEAAAGGGNLSLRQIGDFDSPVYVENAPGAKKLLFVVEQAGTIEVIRRNRTLGRPFLDISNLVEFGGEEGLLGLAFDPGYRKNRRFYVYYVATGGDELRVDMFKRKRKSTTQAGRASRRQVIEIPHPTASNHNGGQLSFGPDGFLYLGPGDGGDAGDPEGDAQNPESLLGKLLRIDPKRKGGHRSPSSNPFVGGPGADEVYAIGLRNPYRFSFDSFTTELAIADVGQNAWEEINRLPLDAARGANFGWDQLEGNHAFEGDPANPPPNYVGPIHEYRRTGGNCAVTGGYVVRDTRLPALRGRYAYGDFCAGDIRSLDPEASDPSATDASTGLRVDSLSGFGEGFKDRVYAVSLDGPVYRIVQE